jgi:hypothetical protein
MWGIRIPSPSERRGRAALSSVVSLLAALGLATSANADGTVTSGPLRAPSTVDRLLERGASLDVSCSQLCDLSLALVVPDPVASRLDLPSRILDGYRGRLRSGVTYAARFSVKPAVGRALLAGAAEDSRQLRLRVVRRNVRWLDSGG